MIRAPSIFYGPGGLVLALVLNACATPGGTEAGGDAQVLVAQPPARNTSLSIEGLGGIAPAAAEQADSDVLQAQTTLFPGTGKFIDSRAASKSASVTPAAGDVTLNFEGASIRDVVKVVFDTLQENYVIDPQVQGEVTVQTSRPLPKDMLIPTLESLLRMNDAALVREGGVYKVVPVASATSKLSPRLSRPKLGFGVRIVPLRYVSASEMQKILEPFVPQGGVLRVDTARNLLILAGTSQELANLQETIDIFDVNWLKGMSVGLYKLQNIDSQTITTELDKMFGEGSRLPLSGMFRFVPVHQLNAVLVITPQPEYLHEAGQWIERLDGSGGERLHVYSVQNGKADYLASVLNAVFGTGESSSALTSRLGQVAPGLQPAQLSTPSLSGQESESNLQTGSRSTPLSSTGSSNGTSSLAGGTSSISSGTGSLSGGASSYTEGTQALSGKSSAPVKAAELGFGAEAVRVVADTENNALLIWADTRNYDKILGALRKLDVTPRQVLVEATIAEVTLTGDLQYGLQWYFKNDVGNYGGTGSLDLQTNVPVNSVLGSGFAYAITDSAGFVRALLSALASESKLKVLSSPQLMVIDNQEASIQVGTQQPITTSSTITDGGNTIQAFQLKDTGVILQVRPQVNAGGLITMDIHQEVTNVGPPDLLTRQSTFDRRAITSRVAVQSGQSIVLGGLIKDRHTKTNSGIPVLYKLPVIGPLFGTVGDNVDRTELVVLLTPRVIETSKDTRAVIDDLKRRMKEVAPMMHSS